MYIKRRYLLLENTTQRTIYVVEKETGKIAVTFKYERRNEGSRIHNRRLANVHKDTLNEEEQKQWNKNNLKVE